MNAGAYGTRDFLFSIIGLAVVGKIRFPFLWNVKIESFFLLTPLNKNNFMSAIYNVFLVLLASAMVCQAADFRTWTSRRGSSVEAELVKYEEGVVKLRTKEPKEFVLKVQDLCLADRQYLVEHADADPEALFGGKLSVPEKDFKKPRPFLKKLDKQLSFGDASALTFDLYETEHFLFAVGKGVSVSGIAETAEACWYGMASQHLEFRANWGTSRLLVVIPGALDIYLELGLFVADALENDGKHEQAKVSQLTWDKVASTSMGVPLDVLEEFNLKKRATVFNVKDVKRFRSKFDSFQTHVLCARLYRQQTGEVSSKEGSGDYALRTGHAYYKEIQLTKKTRTNQISSDYGGDIATKSGFEDGSSWPKILRKMVKKGTIKPKLREMLGVQSANDLTPENLVTMYSLSYFMQSSPKRLAAYAKLVRLIRSEQRVPSAEDLVRIFGYETVSDFEKDWVAFIESRDFR